MENSKKSGRPAAIITGASSGIGLEIGKTLCQMGYEVYGIGRSFDCADIVYEEDVDDPTQEYDVYDYEEDDDYAEYRRERNTHSRYDFDDDADLRSYRSYDDDELRSRY